jgi:hypothetical protein
MWTRLWHERHRTTGRLSAFAPIARQSFFAFLMLLPWARREMMDGDLIHLTVA